MFKDKNKPYKPDNNYVPKKQSESNKSNDTLPEFKILVTASHDVLSFQFKDNTTSFTITNGCINGWELDDTMTKYIRNLTDTEDLRNKLVG